ncbi:hypothetical protein CYMTET_2956 [Cymbomonas tetramitiformis]|uniref:Phospholipid:diacylglycerol acyltransferase n=1 Tax=Cymbomonas tetramitiformis TaxID=36881 RepID=A0AAE0LLV7_9CHLO|nr:hypothetical protein CYMTET_2956 [Cymbomonas tetramitiformis]|eukprot:gene5407-6558_t
MQRRKNFKKKVVTQAEDPEEVEASAQSAQKASPQKHRDPVEIPQPTPGGRPRGFSKKNIQRTVMQVNAHVLEKLSKKRRFAFVVGILMGVMIMLFLETDLGVQQEYVQEYVNMLRVPQGLEMVQAQLARFIPRDAFNLTLRKDRIGLRLLEEAGLQAKHPVVMLPGITSCGLEVWSGEPCTQRYFRQRIWGTMTMVQQFLLDTKCWLRHIALNVTSGLDPAGVKVRAVWGLESADYVIGGFWVWAKIIESLADVGYDSNSMELASYDWRLSFNKLEERDAYFSKLKRTVEHLSAANNNKKVVILAHSMGSNVFHYFVNWVTRQDGGVEATWVHRYIHAFVNIAGPMLGSSKVVTGMYSGESSDIRELSTLGLALTNYVNQKDRVALFRSWGSVASLIPRGGDLLWHSGLDDGVVAGFGEQTAAEDSDVGELPRQPSFDALVYYNNATGGLHHMRNDAVLEEVFKDQRKLLREHWLAKQYGSWYSHGIARTEAEMLAKKELPASWTNVLESQLPYAPEMKIYCVYGVGVPTERNYAYQYDKDGFPKINISHRDKEHGIVDGIGYTDGDATVPLLSLGTPCSYFWKRRLWNPSYTSVIVREIQDKAKTSQPFKPFVEDMLQRDIFQRGVSSADHLDIMGNDVLIEDVLRIATGNDEGFEERVYSNLHKITDRLREKLES